MKWVKSRKLLGLPVIQEGLGEVIGRVADIVIDSGFQVEALMVDSRGGKCRLDMDDLTIGQEAVLVKDLASLKKADGGKDSIKATQRLGMLVLDYDGRELGIMSDLVVEPESKEVQGIEISSGLIKDFIDGRDEISLDNVVSVGQEAVIIQGEEEIL